MAEVLKDLEPKKVFQFFEKITQIPHGSNNEKQISDYLVSFAKQRNLEVIQDSANNVVIRKPGSRGYENSPTVVLQGHMDMVCEKNSDVDIDFEKDPLQLEIDGDYIKAKGTTLGGDDGIAVAYALAILDSDDIKHPPLEVLITTNEENGMTGAAVLKGDEIKGKLLINLDSEDEGKLLVSCAGGLRSKVKLPITRDSKTVSEAYEIKISGLNGGHSGDDINKERANANITLGRVLVNIYKNVEFRLVEINGGAKNNAIPREAKAVISFDPSKKSELEALIKDWNSILKNEYKNTDADIKVELSSAAGVSFKVFTKEATEKTIKLTHVMPNGIYTMSTDIKGLVQSSTNVGILTTEEDSVVYDSAVRSSVRSLKYDILNHTEIIAEAFGAKVEVTSEYPEWEYQKDSKLRDLFTKVYKDLYNEEPKVVAIHAGVECGLFNEKFGGLDMVSLGPDIKDIHTPKEKLGISSTKRTWEYVLKVLEELK